MKKAERNKFNKILLYLFLILVWLLPTIGMLTSFFSIDIEPFKDSSWKAAARVLFIIITMPVYLIYARLIIIEIFPYKNKNALLYFIPYVFTFAFYYQHINDDVLNFIVLDSLPLFLGINLILFFGLIKLIYENSSASDISTILISILLSVIIIGLYYTPVAFLAVYGHHLNKLVSDIGNITTNLIKFYFSILLVTFFNIKAVNNLYKAGKL